MKPSVLGKKLLLKTPAGPNYAVMGALVLAVVAVGYVAVRSYASGPTLAVKVTADTYVSETTPNQNHAGLEVLRTAHEPDRYSYLMLTVPADPRPIVKASLRVYANTPARNGYNLYATSSQWTASRLRYENRPALGKKLGASGKFSNNTWTSVDVTDYVTHPGTYSFAMAAAGKTQTAYSSSESDHKPQLVIEFAGPIDPIPSVSPTPTATSTPNPTPTSTPTETPTPTSTPTPSPTPTSTSSPTPTSTPSPTHTPTPTPTPPISSGTLYLNPSSPSVTIGNNITLSVRENSGTTPVNAIQANITFDSTKLQYVGVDDAGVDFSLSAVTTPGIGKIDLARAVAGGSPAVTGDKLVSRVIFKAIGISTSTSVAVGTGSVISTTQGVDILRQSTPAAVHIFPLPTSTPTPTPTPPPDTQAPTAPTFVTATASSTTLVNVSWKAATDNVGVVSYHVLRNGLVIANVPIVAALVYRDTTVQPGTSYTYRVSALDAAGLESVLSNAATVTTPLPPVIDTTPPSTPGNFTAVAVLPTQVNLSWSVSSDNVGVLGYHVYRDFGLLTNTNATGLNYGDGSVSAGKTYKYHVTAFDAGGNESPATLDITVTTPSSGPLPTPIPSGTPTPTPVPGTGPSAANPCGFTTSVPSTYKHVVWLWMENKKYSNVIGTASAPLQTSLAQKCATAPQYKDAGSIYNSLSNYVAATAGVDSCSGGACAATTWNDCSPSATCTAPIDNIFRQVRAKGGTAKSYEESMPNNCQLSGSGTYAPRHNPAAYFTGGTDRAACLTDDVPMGTPAGGNFLNALATDASLPMFSFITPNTCSDTHDCSIATGDAWLSGWMPKILDSPAYKSGNTVVMVVYDEDTPAPNFFVAPTIKTGTVSTNTALGHYSMLRTTEEMLGITNFLGKASTAPSFRSVYNF